jgi:hypothetical protein
MKNVSDGRDESIPVSGHGFDVLRGMEQFPQLEMQ